MYYEKCETCVHFKNDDEYDWCHWCLMEKDCYSAKEKPDLLETIIDFDEVKQLVLESVGESKNMNELIQLVVNKIYQKGFTDGSETLNQNE